MAFNAPHFEDFVIEAPTLVDPENSDAKAYHYSKIGRLHARNRLFSVKQMWPVGDLRIGKPVIRRKNKYPKVNVRTVKGRNLEADCVRFGG